MFSIATYNLLADCAYFPWQHKQYSRVTPEQRCLQILEKLQEINADIICLQEVMQEHYYKQIKPSVETAGYKGIIYKRGDDLSLVTLFKTNNFILLDEYHFILQDKCREYVKNQGIDEFHTEAIENYIGHPRPYSMLLVKLKHQESGNVLTVGNIHILWDQFQRNDAKALVAACAVKALLSFNGGNNTPHIICGDFNSYPDSPVYHLMENGFVTESSMRDNNIVKLVSCLAVCCHGNKPEFLYDMLPNAIKHATSLKSIYKDATGTEPEITCYDIDDPEKLSYTGCYDYIWFSDEYLDASEAKVDEIAWSDVWKMVKDPATMSHIPSDHLPVSGTLRFKN